MKSLLKLAALTVAALAGLVTAQDKWLQGHYEHQHARIDWSKFPVSACTRKYLAHTARVMTGSDVSEGRKYQICIVNTETDIFFDWKCLCREGDGEGSAIIDDALMAGHVWAECGWQYAWGTSSCQCALVLAPN